ncbi:TAXI family TRAP transporter solute-binding subunit [Reichenbachiella sp.]|uniref:TAXI family TRAP transporter solute-binding subunit n=1 Tax=Reichenbachiella sp. TaxID=2184521 RepID=UPI003298F6AC
MIFKNRFLSILGSVVLSMLFASCGDDIQKYRIIYSAEEPIGQISKQIKDILDQEDEFSTELIIGHGSIANVDSLLKGSADLAIIENHTPVDGEIKSILSLYPQILHILYQSEEEITDFKQLVENKSIFIGPEGSGTHRFMNDLFVFFEVDISKVQIVDDPFDCEIYCAFGDLIKEDNLLGLEDFRLYSFGDVERQGRGSIAEAICLKFPQLKPFIIPKYTYRQLTPEPVLTIAVDAVLVARKDLPEESIYELTKILFHNHQEFTEISPLSYLDLTENFDFNKLNFPLHEGARKYIEKDNPGFFERYAELIGVVFSLLFAGVSGIISFTKWRKQVKKDRIDVFYKRIIDIKNGISKLKSPSEVRGKILELRLEQDKAFELLIDEKLTADVSFRIYMELHKEILNSLLLRNKFLNKEEVTKGVA